MSAYIMLWFRDNTREDQRIAQPACQMVALVIAQVAFQLKAQAASHGSAAFTAAGILQIVFLHIFCGPGIPFSQ